MNGIDFHQYWLHSRSAGNTKPLEDYSMCALAAKNAKFTLPDADPRNPTSHLRYAYHFDAAEYALFLRHYAEKNGVIRQEGNILKVIQDEQSGNISGVTLANGLTIEADFFIDCSGFNALLIGNTLDVPYKDWSHWLPCNSAQAIASESGAPHTALHYFNSKAGRMAMADTSSTSNREWSYLLYRLY
jgi:tryptophan halogenase